MSETSQGHEHDEQFTQRFNDAVDSVRQYNDTHASMAGIASSFLFSMFEDKSGDVARVSPVDKANMEKELVTLLQTDELEAMGVSLVDPSKFFSTDTEPDADLASHEATDSGTKHPVSLIMLISDPDLFTETIHRLKPAPGQQEATQTSVDALLVSTIGLIQTSGATEEGEDEDMSEGNAAAARHVLDTQIGIFMEISPALAEGGFNNSQAYAKLTDYAARHASGTLPDYLGAESRGLLDTGFGPDKWPMDMGAGQLYERWTKAFKYLKGLRDREESSPYFTELFNKLRSDFDTGRTWLEADEDPQAPFRNASKDYIDPLKAMMAELSKVWEEDFPLENSYYLSERTESAR
jgi:hypothetical protein